MFLCSEETAEDLDDRWRVFVEIETRVSCCEERECVSRRVCLEEEGEEEEAREGEGFYLGWQRAFAAGSCRGLFCFNSAQFMDFSYLKGVC